jgi:hypothetical protein
VPRIFHVTFTKEFEATIVAEDEAELRKALDNQSQEFDDWADTADWDVHLVDPLKGVKDPERIPKVFAEADMGVCDGECLAIYDYKLTRPDYLELVNSYATEVARELTVEQLNEKLPFPDGS